MAARSDALFREEELTFELNKLKSRIEEWARQKELWEGAAFKMPFEHRNEAPSEGEILLLTFDGALHSMFAGGHEEWDRLEEEFRGIVESSGFECELADHVTLSIYIEDEHRSRDHLRLQRWHWVQQLAERRLFDLHSEVFEHFASDTDALKNLHWRQFEEFLDSVFRNQGFRTELGPGGNDGGVDLRLYQSDSIPEIVTVVQAKRYTEQPIGLEAVAALTSVALLDRAPHALFATTSRYRPAARKFALATQGRFDMPSLTLAGPEHFQKWCSTISQQLSDYFLTGAQAPPIVRNRPPTELTGRIVVAHWGYNTVRNQFAVVEADYPHEVILRPIGSQVTAGDWQRGWEIPDSSAPPAPYDRPRILAFRSKSEFGPTYFWGDRKLFGVWDGTPQMFDLCD